MRLGRKLETGGVLCVLLMAGALTSPFVGRSQTAPRDPFATSGPARIFTNRASFGQSPLGLRTVQLRPPAVVDTHARVSSTALAEQIGAQQISDWQRRYGAWLKNPQSGPAPTLNPSRIQRVLDEARSAPLPPP